MEGMSMNAKRTLPIALASVLVGLLAAAAALAAGPREYNVQYQFRGELKAASATSVSLTVEGGNRIALKKMLGAGVDQTFAAGPSTEFLKWSKGVPTVVGPADLVPGDWVVVNIRAPRGATLAEVEAKPAGVVSDRGAEPNPAGLPLYLFRGRFVSAGSSTLTVRVGGGNPRSLRLLVGHDRVQTFAYGPETIFLLWQGKVPTVISASQLKEGDRVTVRIRAQAGSSLHDVESTPARHVGDHEPPNA
jgi:hypothetical protein